MNEKFKITNDDIKDYRERKRDSGIVNKPLRNVEKDNFFDALMSDKADFINNNAIDDKLVDLIKKV